MALTRAMPSSPISVICIGIAKHMVPPCGTTY
jgi:hypothetical protein